MSSNSGLKVITTLDADLEHEAEDTVIAVRALTNEKKFNASNAALVAMDPRPAKYSPW